ncbi:ribbon-helix-helix domain-containing protein [Nitrospirillum amazonense]|uniref:ribbon-helix-helix domain-containing protein n=1 Tax=Nitrospirillum amazonense TaxID=28077 RepID=UPI0024122F3D|nr:ribbon-helix-helix domain-containing protein [Nitrospirillum amazonense]MDG3444641.1 ribbon-helix-helix domain-containing protein [Nitrospirillum amazonense]
MAVPIHPWTDLVSQNSTAHDWLLNIINTVNSIEKVPRSVRIGNRRTSMRMEPVFWRAIEEIAVREKTDVTTLLTLIDGFRIKDVNRTSAIRMAVLDYWLRVSQTSS